MRQSKVSLVIHFVHRNNFGLLGIFVSSEHAPTLYCSFSIFRFEISTNMAPSQLKQLKASLRDHGVLGPQKSKKQRKAISKDSSKRLQRNAALEGIRERFNPFEVKTPARKEKFEVATNKPTKAAIGRPGVTRGLGEERRRETLLKEMQSRNKVGGMMDKRFGENDPTMTPEEKAAERFARQAMRTSKKNSMFNLEDDSDEEMVLTHGGRSLELGDATKDDFDEEVSGSEQDDFEGQSDRPSKRIRLDDGAELEEDANVTGMPERRKTKNEVMKEVIAKSKMYKAERQAAKADDDDLRAELDKGMGDFYAALRGQKPPSAKQLPSPPQTDTEPTMDPGRAAMLAGKSREEADKEYEANLQKLKLEARSKPSVRTKTEEEKAAEQAAKLEELERKRLRRMKGEAESSDEEEEEEEEVKLEGDEDEEQDDAEAFGLAQPQYPPRPQLDVEDEDEFVIDDLLDSGSEAEAMSDDEEDGSEDEAELEDDGDDDFINGLVLPKATETAIPSAKTEKPSKNLAYTFPCPQTHAELLEVTQGTKLSDLPTIVQRIRALYHKGLAQENQAKQAKFAAVLLQHIAYLGDSNEKDLPMSVIESLIRHLHSMAKSQPEDVGLAFRNRLREIAEERPLQLGVGDVLVLTAVSTIFPTSDHFHSVVTPAMLTIARYLGQTSVQSFTDLGIGAYCCSLALQYQSFAKRVVPEVMTYIVNALAILAPAPIQSKASEPLSIPIRLPESPLRLKQTAPKPRLDLSFQQLRKAYEEPPTAAALLKAFLVLSEQLTQVWQKKTAFSEFVAPIEQVITHLLGPSCKDALPLSLRVIAQNTSKSLTDLVNVSISSRKPLLLHSHRPLAIKSSIPAFIENFNPDRHYDPDRERAEMAKLKAEHKKEKKGAMRELRKDANFVAREQLREKKAKDEAYDKKFKRLVAEIQSEEGRENKEYEREKRKRKGKA